MPAANDTQADSANRTDLILSDVGGRVSANRLPQVASHFVRRAMCPLTLARFGFVQRAFTPPHFSEV